MKLYWIISHEHTEVWWGQSIWRKYICRLKWQMQNMSPVYDKTKERDYTGNAKIYFQISGAKPFSALHKG